MMKVRAKALETFGERVITMWSPLSELENKLVPIYLSHRYQVEAAAKVLGGVDYRYALRGDNQTVAKIVAPEEQRKALRALIDGIKPEALVLPEKLLILMPPPAMGYPRGRESFKGRTGLTFDALAPAEAAINLTIGLVLHPERASRLVQNAARDSKNPSLEEVISALTKASFEGPAPAGLNGEIRSLTQISLVYHLMALASEQRAAPSARSKAFHALNKLDVEPWLKSQIKRFEDDPKTIPLPRPLEAPPGMPIGDDEAPLW
ncbi:MAG: zinc-dependent metalloprotease, partial [Chloroflexia bacterium]